LKGFPDDLALTRKIFVSEDIAHTEDLAPRDMRMTRLQVIVDTLGRLANREKPIRRRVLNVWILQECLPCQPVGLSPRFAR
jgi:hypothetical protein